MQRRNGLEYPVREITDDQNPHPAYGGKIRGGEKNNYQTQESEEKTDHKKENLTITEIWDLRAREKIDNLLDATDHGRENTEPAKDFLMDRNNKSRLPNEMRSELKTLDEKKSLDPDETMTYLADMDRAKESAIEQMAKLGYSKAEQDTVEQVLEDVKRNSYKEKWAGNNQTGDSAQTSDAAATVPPSAYQEAFQKRRDEILEANAAQAQANYAAAPLNAYQEALQKWRDENAANTAQSNYATNHKDEHQARAEALIEKATNHVTSNGDKMAVENIFGNGNAEWMARDPKESITLEQAQRFQEELVNHLVDQNVRGQESVIDMNESTTMLTRILNGSPYFQEQNEIREYDQRIRWDENSNDSRITIRAMAYGDSDKKLSDHIHEVSEYFEKKSHFTDSGSKSNVWDRTNDGAASFAGHRAEEMLENAEQTAFALEANIVKIAELQGGDWQVRLDARNLEKKNMDYIEQIHQDLRNADFNSKFALTYEQDNGTDTTVWDQEKWDQDAKRKEEEDRKARSLMGKIGNLFRPKTEQEEATD